MFSCTQGQTSGSNIIKKMFWWNHFCNNIGQDGNFNVAASLGYCPNPEGPKICEVAGLLEAQSPEKKN